MSILSIVSILSVGVAFFLVGIFLSLVARKFSENKKSLWSYAKVLLLALPLIFLAEYLLVFGLSELFLGFYWLKISLVFLVYISSLVGLVFFFSKNWYKYEKVGLVFWGILAFLTVIFLSYNFSFPQPFLIKDAGMAPNFNQDDLVFCQVNRNLFGGYSKGDVVVFSDPQGGERKMIRKIIATEGDSVKINGGQLFVNDQVIRSVQPNELIAPIVLQPGENFVLAQDEKNLYDSKAFGPIRDEDIQIKVLFKLHWLNNETNN